MHFEVSVKNLDILFICLATNNTDYELYINGKLESLISTSDVPRCMNEKKDPIEPLIYQNSGIIISDLKMTHFVDQTNNIKNLFERSKLKSNENPLSEEIFKKNHTIHEFKASIKNDNFFESQNHQKSGKMSETFSEKNNDFSFVETINRFKKIVKNFDSISSKFYPNDTTVVERKITYRNLRSILKNYEFLFSVISLVSPPLLSSDLSQNEVFSQLTLQEHISHDTNSFQTPFCGIAFKTLRKTIERFFVVDIHLFQTLYSMLSETPFLIKKCLTTEPCDHLTDIVIYDQALFLLRCVFLTDEEQCQLTEDILASKNYSVVNLCPTEDNYIKRIINCAKITASPMISFRALFPSIIDVHFEEELNSISSLVTTNFDFAHKCRFEQITEKNVRLVFSFKNQQSELILENYTLKLDNNEKSVEINCLDIKSIVLLADIRECHTLKLKTNSVKVRLIAKSIENSTTSSLKLSKSVLNLPNGALNFSIIFSKKGNSFLGILTASAIKSLSPRPHSTSLHLPFMDLINEKVNPAFFDISTVIDLSLRFEINCFSKVEYEKNQRTVSLLKFKPNEYISNAKALKISLESLFPKCAVSFNSFGPVKIGEFRLFLKGFFQTQFSSSTSIDLFSNSESTGKADINEIYVRLCFLIVENFPIDGLIEAQNSYFNFHKISSIIVQPLNEDEVNLAKNQTSRTSKTVTTRFVCNNYGCSMNFDSKENVEKCNGHHGTWDFGHTGTNLEDAMKDGSCLLWEPHWTCCGRNWKEQCSNFHFHEHKDNRMNIDLEDLYSQKVFRKNIRQNWLKKISNIENLDEMGIRKRISHYCTKNALKLTVS